MAPSAPNQLSDGDSIFLSMETPNSGGHVGAVMLLDPSSTDGLDFEKLRSHIASRVALVPRFSWKLQSVPLGLDRPYWVEAEGFLPSDHIIRTAVPSPGNIQQVYALAARLHCQPLDRSRPLWQVWCIEGLEGGRTAIYMKTHHCLIDGTGGAGLAEVMADLSPDATGPLVAPEAFVEDRPIAPSPAEMATRAIRNGSERPGKLLGHLRRGISELWSARRQESATGELERTPFNTGISKRRAFASTSFDFERIRDLTKHFDVKVNDVALEIAGSAVRRWLRDRGEAPQRSLVAMCPVSTRGDEQGLGNQITSMSVSLCTDVADPAERLRGIHESSKLAKQKVEKGSFIDWTAAMGESFAPAVTQLLVRAAELSADSGPLPANFVVSNVRSAPVPLYVAGARVESMMPLSLLAVGNGLNVTLVSYCNRIDVGIIVDPELIPDPWELAEYFPVALEELETAAEGVVHRAR
jgi:WS/DGAT/MGAT family acyltransferase